MSDLIDRQAALKKIGQINGILLFNGAILINYLDAEKAIEELPSAQPEPCEDAVSRKAVEEILQSGLPARGMWEIEGDVVKQTVCETLADALMDLERLPSVTPEQRWIPVTERLPEKEGWYITTVESEKTGKRRVKVDLFAIDIALAHGLTPNKFCKDGYRQRTVAWCEFPEPRKEGDSE